MPYANKEDQKAFHAGWYQKNRDRIIAKSKVSNRRIKRERIEWLNEIKATIGCKICGEDRGPCLDFHHINPDEKEQTIARTAGDMWSKERIRKEIEKCVVLCANCHRLIHARHASVAEWFTQQA